MDYDIKDESFKLRDQNDISSKKFKQIFKFEENERDKKMLKKEFKEILAQVNIEGANLKKIKFKHIIDFYLSDGQAFKDSLRSIDSQNVLYTIQSPEYHLRHD